MALAGQGFCRNGLFCAWTFCIYCQRGLLWCDNGVDGLGHVLLLYFRVELLHQWGQVGWEWRGSLNMFQHFWYSGELSFIFLLLLTVNTMMKNRRRRTQSASLIMQQDSRRTGTWYSLHITQYTTETFIDFYWETHLSLDCLSGRGICNVKDHVQTTNYRRRREALQS